jgi:hypothetical protein
MPASLVRKYKVSWSLANLEGRMMAIRAWIALPLYIAALPWTMAAPLSFHNGGAEITMEVVPYQGAQCATAQCRANAFAILGHHRATSVVASLTVKRNGHVYHLPTDGMVDPQIGSVSEAAERIKLSCDTVDNCTLRGVFGDAGGVYVCEWLIIDNTVVRTVFSPSQDLFNFVRTHLSAPAYE